MHASEQNWGFSDACRNTTHLDPYTNCQSILSCAKAGEEPTGWKGGRRNLMLTLHHIPDPSPLCFLQYEGLILRLPSCTIDQAASSE